ncbi:MAG: hypothetical protein HQL87_15170 [Magnetococcales bacterium]|nr:hypothetical protein [Magnetococcales bacterium]
MNIVCQGWQEEQTATMDGFLLQPMPVRSALIIVSAFQSEPWIPACAGMTSDFRVIPIPVMPAKAGIQESSWTKR